MQVYNIVGKINETKSGMELREFKKTIKDNTIIYNEEQENVQSYIYKYDEVLKAVSFNINGKFNIEEFKKYLKALGIEAIDLAVEEITLRRAIAFLELGNASKLTNDKVEILEFLNIQEKTLDIYETIAGEIIKGGNIKNLSRHPLHDDVVSEIERIKKGKKMANFIGHPVHYMIECDDVIGADSAVRALVIALKSKGRLESNRISRVAFFDDEYVERVKLDEIYQISKGGCVWIRYNTSFLMDKDVKNSADYTIEAITDIINKYKNEVLTILEFPKECKVIKDVFFMHLENISIVELKEKLLYKKEAKEYLLNLAKNKGIEPDDLLFNKLKDDGTYVIKDLKQIFDSWFNNALKTKIYPEYMDSINIKEEIKEKAVTGLSYDELNSLIGLVDVKKAIDEILCEKKAEMIFRNRGLAFDNSSLHMVFTGNPGTCKTTVARIFAKIMKENDVLSYGHLVEVSRSELVGKYVGWTADIVKEKFKKARGGVLFIDEAYSLVDDRDNSFGDEAINEIVSQMENNRENTIVIFAGYPNKMEKFLDRNPGLKSRISYKINFPDYTEEELVAISEQIAEKKGLLVSNDAKKKLLEEFRIKKEERDFGNGRYARNVIEKAKRSLSKRLVNLKYDDLTDDDIRTITKEDIELSKNSLEKWHIGFN